MSSFEQEEIALLRQRIVRLEAQVDFLYKHLGVTFSENAYETDDPQVIEALKRNNIIEAIKYYREKTGLGLAEAKSAVEGIKKRRGI
jgi:ribosomal protein L7/L12